MNRRLTSFALAAAAVGGIAAAVVPQHIWSIARVVAVAVAVLAGAAVLAAVGAVTGQDPEVTALDRVPGGTASPLDPHGLRDARRDLGRPTQSGAVPPPVWERLRVAALLAMAERGLDIDSPRTRMHARRLLSSPTWELLTTQPAPGGTPAPDAVATTVNRILDELDTIPTGARS